LVKQAAHNSSDECSNHSGLRIKENSINKLHIFSLFLNKTEKFKNLSRQIENFLSVYKMHI
jgi:hypothetical protein